jgi:NAD(P)-dependent dehydrogenase (short-subunit alcohol dehydrogenase family)
MIGKPETIDRPMQTSARSVLITGTTSGVGRGLLDHYATSGARVVSVNRRQVLELEARYPRVRFEHADVRDRERIDALVASLARAGELPEILILNAGINRVDNDESFELENYRAVVETNLYGVLNFVAPLTRLQPSGVPRHLIALSSMANYVGNPYGLGYHTSKRALSACFDTWSRMYAGTDLVFQQVLLGPVRTGMFAMDDDFPAWMVRVRDGFSASLEGTVQAIARFARTRERKLFYPRRAIGLYLGMRLGQSLIPGFFQGRATRGGDARRKPASQGAGAPSSEKENHG